MTTRLRRPLINSNPGVLLIKGGPGTGKTVVALHRVAYLLYTRLRAKIATCYDWEIDEDGDLLDWESQLSFTSGQGVEISLAGAWLPGRFEHGAVGYYLIVDNTIITPHQGLRARVKRW